LYLRMQRTVCAGAGGEAAGARSSRKGRSACRER
jgi:hypothetical protein